MTVKPQKNYNGKRHDMHNTDKFKNKIFNIQLLEIID